MFLKTKTFAPNSFTSKILAIKYDVKNIFKNILLLLTFKYKVSISNVKSLFIVKQVVIW